MELTPNFRQLWKIAKQIDASKSNFTLDQGIKPIDPIDVRLSGDGIEVKPEELDLNGGLFSYAGRQVVLYIPNHTNKGIEKALVDKSERKKFHVTFCKHLEDMKRKKQFDKYIATNNLSGSFHIFGKSKINKALKEGNVELDVCMYCLQKLYYQGASNLDTSRIIRDSFDIPEFFSTYSSFFPFFPSGIGGDPTKADYTPDWREVSNRYKTSRNYTCEQCHVNLNNHKSLLHTHHIDTIAGNNRPENLMALCADCHRKEHGHMHVSHSNMQIITKLRREQNINLDNWESALNLADPALNGILRKLQAKKYEPPELGLTITDKGKTVEADAAWPARKLAITIHKTNKSIPGWKIVQPGSFL